MLEMFYLGWYFNPMPLSKIGVHPYTEQKLYWTTIRLYGIKCS